MLRRPPRSTRTDTLFPYTTLFRSRKEGLSGFSGGRLMAMPNYPAVEDRRVFYGAVGFLATSGPQKTVRAEPVEALHFSFISRIRRRSKALRQAQGERGEKANCRLQIGRAHV